MLGLVVSEKKDDDLVVNVDGLEIYLQNGIENISSDLGVDYKDSGLRMGFSVSN